jgi:hypothetical protein
MVWHEDEGSPIMNESPVTVENRNDPDLLARIKARAQRAQRNRDWLDAHLAELLPRAYGKLIAVAGQEPFIAKSEEEAKSWACAAHPEDDGLVIRVMPHEHEIDPNMNPVTLEIETDREKIALSRAQDERFKRNSDWLQSHWADLLPQALGKHLVVAGQEAFVADTPEEAWAMAEAAHPDDDGSFGQYVLPHRGPRIYAHHWRMAGV